MIKSKKNRRTEKLLFARKAGIMDEEKGKWEDAW